MPGRRPAVDLVVVGLGYVGLPLAVEAAHAGLRVVGVDLDAAVVEGIARGRSHVGDIADDDLRSAVEAGLRATTDPAVVADAEAVVICVPTPLDDDRTPDLSAVRGAAGTIATRLRSGALVVLESTTYPGTTEDLLRPILEQGSGLVAGEDFHLAFSPERIDPGNRTWTLRNTPKVVGGLTAGCAKAAAALYDHVCDTVVLTRGTREAEMAKLLENTYRHVNIALVNEMAVFCDDLGIDLWDAIGAAATKPFGFAAFRPGPGVGGHCIPIDPSYLSHTVRSLGYPFRFVELAQEVNERMPAYVAARSQRLLNDQRKPVNGSKILLLGVTYKADVADERESPAVAVGEHLLRLGADLTYHDPHVDRWCLGDREVPRAGDPLVAAASADLTVLLQRHACYDLDALAREARAVLDTRGVMDGDRIERM